MNQYFDFFNEYSDYYIGIAKDEFQKLHIHRKIEHSKRVYKLAVEIAQKLELTDQQIHLVGIASLFHDIGRFKQVTLLRNFSDKGFDHADYGVKILFEENLIRKFIQTNKYDEIIYKAIKSSTLIRSDIGGTELY